MLLKLTQTISKVVATVQRTRTTTSSDHAMVDQILSQSCQLESVGDAEINRRALNLRERCQSRLQAYSSNHFDRTKLENDELVEASALVSESVRRITGKRYFKVQLLAGAILSAGRIAEMQTGEGKTLTSAIPVFALSLLYPSVHIAAPNAYLAERDCEELRRVYEMLGLSVGLLPEKPDEATTRKAYDSAITYGAGYAFGFDYLRDDLKRRQQPAMGLGWETLLAIRGQQPNRIRPMQSRLWASLIDEIDSVLLDEAMTPLILSLNTKVAALDRKLYALAHQVANSLEQGEDFQIQSLSHQVILTSGGRDKAERCLTDFNESLYQELKRPWTTYVLNALQAQYVLNIDEDFVVLDNKVQLVDQNTGRIFSDRSWKSGLQQAVEQYVGAEITSEKSSAGRITRQSYYRQYTTLCGMTGTAIGAEPEFKKIYGLETVRIPLNQPSKRNFLPDRVFGSRQGKFEAIAKEVLHRSRAHQPILVGTRTISDSEALSSLFAEYKIPHVILNGKQDKEEAEIIREAGRAGRVTVATNMAGRGTDIKPDSAAINAGGLHVICIERHESRRVDLQFAGRAARAGSPGSCQFFISADDELITRHDVKLAKKIKLRSNATGECQCNFTQSITRIQSRCERLAFHSRWWMMENDKSATQLISDHSPKGVR